MHMCFHDSKLVKLLSAVQSLVLTLLRDHHAMSMATCLGYQWTTQLLPFRRIVLLSTNYWCNPTILIPMCYSLSIVDCFGIHPFKSKALTHYLCNPWLTTPWLKLSITIVEDFFGNMINHHCFQTWSFSKSQTLLTIIHQFLLTSLIQCSCSHWQQL